MPKTPIRNGKPFSLRIPDDLKDAFLEAVEAEDRSQTTVLVRLLTKYCEESGTWPRVEALRRSPAKKR